MLILKYAGRDADAHRLDALTGGESLQGIGHALALIAHFAATGNVRQRAPYSKDARFYFSANRSGSLDWLIEFSSTHQTEILIGLGVNGVSAFVGYIFAKVIGHDKTPSDSQLRELDERRSGDIDALVEAVEPSIKRAHRVIGQSAGQIFVINGSNNNVLVTFDAESKDYVETDVPAGLSSQDVAVASLNVNSKYGRVYFFDLYRTVPFKIDKDAHPRTLTQLSRALDNYAKKNGKRVNITFDRVHAKDGRLKRIVIHDAWQLESDAL